MLQAVAKCSSNKFINHLFEGLSGEFDDFIGLGFVECFSLSLFDDGFDEVIETMVSLSTIEPTGDKNDFKSINIYDLPVGHACLRVFRHNTI